MHLINLLITAFCSLRSEFPAFLVHVPVMVMSFWLWTGRKGLLRSILEFGVLLAWLVVATVMITHFLFGFHSVSEGLYSNILKHATLSSALFLFLSAWPMRYLSGWVGIELRHFDCSGPVTLSDVFFVTTLISSFLGAMLIFKDVFAQHSEQAMSLLLSKRVAVYDQEIQIVWSGSLLFPIVIGLLCALVYVPICRIVNNLFLSKMKWPLRLFVSVHSLIGIAAFLTISVWNFTSGYEGIAGIIMAEALVFLSIVALNVVVRRLAQNNANRECEIGD